MGNDHNFNVICEFTVVIGTCVRETPPAGWVQWPTSLSLVAPRRRKIALSDPNIGQCSYCEVNSRVKESVAVS